MRADQFETENVLKPHRELPRRRTIPTMDLPGIAEFGTSFAKSFAWL
jgi:hypothetical protein